MCCPGRSCEASRPRDCQLPPEYLVLNGREPAGLFGTVQVLATKRVQTFRLAYHFRFDERLQGINLSIVLTLNQLHFAKSTFANDLDRLEVLWSLLCSQEAKEFSFSFAHLVLLLFLAGFGDVWIFQNVL